MSSGLSSAPDPSAAEQPSRPRRASTSSLSASKNRQYFDLSKALSAGAGVEGLELSTVRSNLSFSGGSGLDRQESKKSVRKIQTGKAAQQTILEAEERTDTDTGTGSNDKEKGSESSTLDETPEEVKTRLFYGRFSESRKRGIVGIVAYAALLAPFASSSFLPSIPSIVADLDTSPTIINASIAVFLVTLAIFPLLYAPYSGIYGRKPIYVISLPIFAVGSLGTALSRNLASLMICRIIQGIGSSAVLSVGAGTIGDLFPRERRGRAMGLFYAGVLVGPATAPAIAGVLTEYVQPFGSGWRAMQYLLFSMGIVASLLVTLCLPETSHVRGIDLIREERRLRLAERTPEQVAVEDARVKSWYEERTKDWVVVFLNPLKPLKILVNPHILAMSINSSFVLMSTYTVLVPLAYTLAPRYGITNAAILGCLYLASGLGNIFATRFTGRYADYVLRRYADGTYSPEHRLYASLIGSGIVLPGAVLSLGWVIEKTDGLGGLIGALILLFCNGVGLMMVLTPTNTYCIDCMLTRSAEVIAVNNCIRYLFSAAASAFVLPLIGRIGVGGTNTIAAVLCWCGFALVLLVIRYGASMRRVGAQWEGIEISEAEQIKEVRLERELLVEEMEMVKEERGRAGGVALR